MQFCIVPRLLFLRALSHYMLQINKQSRPCKNMETDYSTIFIIILGSLLGESENFVFYSDEGGTVVQLTSKSSMLSTCAFPKLEDPPKSRFHLSASYSTWNGDCKTCLIIASAFYVNHLGPVDFLVRLYSNLQAARLKDWGNRSPSVVFTTYFNSCTEWEMNTIFLAFKT